MLKKSLCLFLIVSAYTIAQVPDSIQRFRNDNLGSYRNKRQGTMIGNRINTLFYNDLEIGKANFPPTCEWPAGSSHNYLDGYTFMVSAEVTAPGDTIVIHPLETAYREEYSMDPVTQTPWCFEPIVGYSNPNSTSPAISINKTTWPSQWPAALNLSADYNGHWYGYFGKDAFNADMETYFALDDSQDKKFTLSPYKYFPITSDSSRGGLGLRAEVREFQWRDSLLQDILFIKYDVWNISDYDYNKAIFGIYCDVGIGGANMTEPTNSAGVDSINDLAYSWAPGGIGIPGNWKTGYFGIGILGSPGNPKNVGITSMSSFVIKDTGPTSPWPKNNEVIWAKMNGGMDTLVQNANITIIIGSGPFAFKKWAKEVYTSSIIMGNDLNDIINKKFIAQATYNNNFVLPDSINTLVEESGNVTPSGFKLVQNYPNPFNPSTTINYSVPKSSMITIKVYDALGNEVETLVNGQKNPGNYKIIFNAGKLASGVYFYQMRSSDYISIKKMILLK